MKMAKKYNITPAKKAGYYSMLTLYAACNITKPKIIEIPKMVIKL